MNVVDSSGWIEFFVAGPNGPRFRAAVSDEANLIVPVIALYEVHRRLCQLIPEQTVNACIDVMRKGQIVELTDARAIAASKMAQAHRLALADAAMYAIAQEFGAAFWTQDIDYKGLPGVKYIAKR